MDETKYGWWLPMDVSTHGAKIDQLIAVLHWFMLLLFVGWGAFFVYCLIKYRAREGHAAIYAPVKAIATKYIEAAVVVVEVFLLFALQLQRDHTAARSAHAQTEQEQPQQKQVRHQQVQKRVLDLSDHHNHHDVIEEQDFLKLSLQLQVQPPQQLLEDLWAAKIFVTEKQAPH